MDIYESARRRARGAPLTHTEMQREMRDLAQGFPHTPSVQRLAAWRTGRSFRWASSTQGTGVSAEASVLMSSLDTECANHGNTNHPHWYSSIFRDLPGRDNVEEWRA